MLSNWDKTVRSVAKAVNAISCGINWVAKKLGLDFKIAEWKPKGYEKGTSKSGHPGGSAIVGEAGKELAWIPGKGITMLGQKGAEFHPNLPKGTAVLPNDETENLFKFGFPGYEKGIGDFFTLAFSGAEKLMAKVFEKFIPTIESPGGDIKKLIDGILSS